jgi:hypothetical protein
LLIKDQIEPVHFECARPVLHRILSCLQGGIYNLVDLRPHVCLPRELVFVVNVLPHKRLKLLM